MTAVNYASLRSEIPDDFFVKLGKLRMDSDQQDVYNQDCKWLAEVCCDTEVMRIEVVRNGRYLIDSWEFHYELQQELMFGPRSSREPQCPQENSSPIPHCLPAIVIDNDDMPIVPQRKTRKPQVFSKDIFNMMRTYIKGLGYKRVGYARINTLRKLTYRLDFEHGGCTLVLSERKGGRPMVACGEKSRVVYNLDEDAFEKILKRIVKQFDVEKLTDADCREVLGKKKAC